MEDIETIVSKTVSQISILLNTNYDNIICLSYGMFKLSAIYLNESHEKYCPQYYSVSNYGYASYVYLAVLRSLF